MQSNQPGPNNGQTAGINGRQVSRSSGAEIMPVIGRQVQLVQAMLSAARNQREALTKMDTDALEKACAQQSQLSDELRVTERKRLNIVAALLGVSLRNARVVTMSELIPHLPPAYEGDMCRFREVMANSTREMQQLNKLNRILTERAKKFTRETLNVLTNDGQPLYSARI